MLNKQSLLFYVSDLKISKSLLKTDFLLRPVLFTLLDDLEEPEDDSPRIYVRTCNRQVIFVRTDFLSVTRSRFECCGSGSELFCRIHARIKYPDPCLIFGLFILKSIHILYVLF